MQQLSLIGHITSKHESFMKKKQLNIRVYNTKTLNMNKGRYNTKRPFTFYIFSDYV